MERIKLYTIGFTRKSAEQFFTVLSKAGVRRVIDIRLNNVSQLAGFAKRDDLRYFLKAICGIDYRHLLMLAPTKEILDEYRKNPKNWSTYERSFLRLIAEREIEKHLTKDLIDRSCLLCGEETPDHCHRRLVAEYLLQKWGNIEITHLV
jgi:uncharacterized protein (DUF488 family)